jgi:nitrite reductase/ring-hydroxylating ferredoxin subunit
LQRIFGISATHSPTDPEAWTFSDGKIVVDLERVPELVDPGRGIRLEAKGLPERVLLVHGVDGRYYAFRNRCGHGGRRLDPDPDEPTLPCCSLGRTTYDYTGRILDGPAKTPVTPCRVDLGTGGLIIPLWD